MEPFLNKFRELEDIKKRYINVISLKKYIVKIFKVNIPLPLNLPSSGSKIVGPE